MRLRRLRTDELAPAEVVEIRGLLRASFGTDPEERFTDDDWHHAVNGVHFVLDVDGEILAHASVVERELRIAGDPISTGYVEAVATAPEHQRTGLGTVLMRDVGAYLDERYDLGALGTGSHRFYERLGWRTWRGPSSVRTAAGEQPTPDEDGYIMVLATRSSPPLDLDLPISCAWRPGDVW